MNEDDQMDQIMTSLFSVVRAVNHGAHFVGLDKSAIIALYAIRQLDMARPSAVAGACALDQSTISRHLKSLEDRGLVERSPDPADRRAQLLSVTRDGAQLLADQDALRRERLEAAIADWSEADRDQLRAVLDRLADSIIVANARRMAGFGH